MEKPERFKDFFNSGMGCSFTVKHVFSLHEALRVIPGTKKERNIFFYFNHNSVLKNYTGSNEEMNVEGRDLCINVCQPFRAAH